MNIDALAKIVGVLGFIISLAAFALTRWERRVVVHFGLDTESRQVAESEDAPYMEMVTIILTNLGGRPVVLDLRTLEVRGRANVLFPWQQDHRGEEAREVLLQPNDQARISLPLKTFVSELKIESPEKYDESSFYRLLPLQVRVKSTGGKVFESSKLRYWEAVGEFHRA